MADELMVIHRGMSMDQVFGVVAHNERVRNEKIAEIERRLEAIEWRQKHPGYVTVKALPS
jgi:hypothetical protein